MVWDRSRPFQLALLSKHYPWVRPEPGAHLNPSACLSHTLQSPAWAGSKGLARLWPHPFLPQWARGEHATSHQGLSVEFALTEREHVFFIFGHNVWHARS